MKKVILIVALLFIGGLVFGVSQILKDPKAHDTNIRKIMEACEVSSEQGDKIWTVLKECGMTGINEIARDELLDTAYTADDMGFRIKTGEHEVILYLNGQKEVHLVRWAGNVLYDSGK